MNNLKNPKVIKYLILAGWDFEHFIAYDDMNDEILLRIIEILEKQALGLDDKDTYTERPPQ